MSTPAARMSSIVVAISSSVSPSPSIRLVLVSTSGRKRFACVEHAQRLLVARARIAHRMRQATHGFDILREHFEAARNDRLDVGQLALEVGRERLDGGVRIRDA